MIKKTLTMLAKICRVWACPLRLPTHGQVTSDRRAFNYDFLYSFKNLHNSPLFYGKVI